MPEGPEIKLSVDSVRETIINKKILQVHPHSNSRYISIESVEGLANFIKNMDNCYVKDIKCRGKFIYWEFSNNWFMFNTFGMSGQYSTKEGKHPCFTFKFIDNTKLVFNDPRHFGTIKFTDNEQELTDKLKKMGWDALQHNLEKNLLFINNKLSKTSKPIAQVLLDQSIFAGVGNYIRAEALYEAKISPWRDSNKLSKDEVRNLCECIINVVKTSYAHQGATIKTYKTAFGEEGKYSSLFKVYSKDIDPLGNKVITEISSEGRTIHWVPEIQK